MLLVLVRRPGGPGDTARGISRTWLAGVCSFGRCASSSFGSGHDHSNGVMSIYYGRLDGYIRTREQCCSIEQNGPERKPSLSPVDTRTRSALTFGGLTIESLFDFDLLCSVSTKNRHVNYPSLSGGPFLLHRVYFHRVRRVGFLSSSRTKVVSCCLASEDQRRALKSLSGRSQREIVDSANFSKPREF